MSFETVAAISTVTEAVVISAIVIIFANAFSHGELANTFARLIGRTPGPVRSHVAALQANNDDHTVDRAA